VHRAPRPTRPAHPAIDDVEAKLWSALRRALHGPLLAGLGLGAACTPRSAPSAPPPAPSPAGSTSAPPANDARPITCGPSGFAVSAAGLRPALPYDSLALRRYGGFREGGGPGWTVPVSELEVLSEVGTPCASAQGPACKEQVSHHPAELVRTVCVQVCSELSVVTTRGDTVARWATPAEITTLLAPIDSADDALLRVASEGYGLDCDAPERTTVREVEGGYLVQATRMTAVCAPIVITRFDLFVARDGHVETRGETELSRHDGACVGRVPHNLVPPAARTPATDLGAYLAACAHLEAAAVHAFDGLSHELRAHGAPAELVGRAERAAREEAEHARVVGLLAERHGGVPAPTELAPSALRGLEDIALDNAVEGCVRETYGALVGVHQSLSAHDPAVRAAMAQIAKDELAHASLAFAVQHWLMGQLDAAARERVRVAQRTAIAQLGWRVLQHRPSAAERSAGLPPPAIAERMFAELCDQVWGEVVSAA
jgi:hypothetical protein